MSELNVRFVPDGFVAKARGELFCYECAFHTTHNHDFGKCMDLSGNMCQPSQRPDKKFVVFLRKD